MGSDENSQELSNRRSSLTVYGLGVELEMCFAL